MKLNKKIVSYSDNVKRKLIKKIIAPNYENNVSLSKYLSNYLTLNVDGIYVYHLWQ